MLDLLHIENIAVIEQADISFRPGFNVLTGETGAGKSIVVDSVNLAVFLVRGERDFLPAGASDPAGNIRRREECLSGRGPAGHCQHASGTGPAAHSDPRAA